MAKALIARPRDARKAEIRPVRTSLVALPPLIMAKRTSGLGLDVLLLRLLLNPHHRPRLQEVPSRSERKRCP
jgi:hypothetical protein